MKTSIKVLALLCVVSTSLEVAARGMQSPIDGDIPAPPIGKDEIHPAKWEAAQRDGRKWTVHTYDQVGNIGASLMSRLPSDGESFCPGFNKLSDSGRKNFYTHLLSAMSKFESNYDPSTQYREAFNDANGNRVISRGLLQLSIESANGYGCNIRRAEELHDPYINLNCAIRILDRWVGRDGRITGQVSGSWRGGARYWSVLRKDSTLSQIRGWTREFCAKYY